VSDRRVDDPTYLLSSRLAGSADDAGMAACGSMASGSVHPSVAIGGRAVGSGCGVYVIAEAGVNHDGDASKARRLVEAAKNAGADAVKFQVFDAERLAGADAPRCQYQKASGIGAGSQRDMLRRLELPPREFHEIRHFAQEVGIEFLATPFGVREVHFLDSLDVAAIKIASPDIVNVPLLEAAVQTGRPLILSTGAAELHEIDRAVEMVRGRQSKLELVLLHCVSAYPTAPRESRLGCIRTLAGRFGVPVGFSDHTAEPEFGALAVAAGAVVLEKHLTLSRGAAGPDHFFSLEPEQFARYVSTAKMAAEAMGDGQVRPSAAEREVRRLARGSIVAARALRAGEILREQDLIVQRPGGGIEASRWRDVLGRSARADIPARTPLAWSMLS